MDLISMRKAALVVAAFVSPLVVLYLTTAFVKWDMNPATWSEFARFCVGLFGVTCGCMAAYFVFDADD